jgi:hypothetical protein
VGIEFATIGVSADKRSSLRPPQPATEDEKMKTIDIGKLPELRTRVGIHGSARQQEVGGVFCAGVVVIVNS